MAGFIKCSCLKSSLVFVESSIVLSSLQVVSHGIISTTDSVAIIVSISQLRRLRHSAPSVEELYLNLALLDSNICAGNFHYQVPFTKLALGPQSGRGDAKPQEKKQSKPALQPSRPESLASPQ